MAGFVTTIFYCLLAATLVTAPAAKAQSDAFSIMRSYGDFSTFCDLIERADLVGAFQAGGPITVFAPADKAFARMNPADRSALDDPQRLAQLRALLLYHLVDRRLSAFELKMEKPYGTVGGKKVEFLDMGGSLMINDAFIDTTNIRASNGLIHAIDKVLTLPH